MKKGILIAFMFLPLFAISQDLADTSTINIVKNWSQEPNGYTYPIHVKVPMGTVPQDGFPVCILLHGNGGNGAGMVAQFSNILNCHALVAPTGYQNTWNICAETSDAPDIEMINDLVNQLQTYSNINPNQIRILGSSNGGGLANRVFIENTNAGIDIVCAIVTQLHEPQYHSGGFYKPSGATDPSSTHCGYDASTNPLSSRKYLSICNDNDLIISHDGGTSVVGVDFLPAETAAFVIAQNQGYTGNQITSPTTIGNPAVSEFSYMSGKVVYLEGNAGHSTNTTQRDYIKDFFSDCSISSNLERQEIDEIKVYPNPTNGNIVIERTTTEEMPYSIFNMLGQQVCFGISRSKSMTINISELPANLYFLKMDNQTIKILKE